MLRTHGAAQIRPGLEVYGASGEKIGTVADASERFFVIENDFPLANDLYVPMSAIAAVADDRVELNRSKDELERGSFIFPIGDGPSLAESDPKVDSEAASRSAAGRP
jgi:hypothetical protein